jgi:hypothetical protein
MKEKQVDCRKETRGDGVFTFFREGKESFFFMTRPRPRRRPPPPHYLSDIHSSTSIPVCLAAEALLTSRGCPGKRSVTATVVHEGKPEDREASEEEEEDDASSSPLFPPSNHRSAATALESFLGK